VTWVPPRLDERVALVTGATRGIGRGVALGLGEAGATVYVSGRTAVDDAAAEVTARGGRGVPVPTDHAHDARVEALFERIARESGRLDFVVGNAWGGYADHDWRTFDAPLWEQPLSRRETMFEAEGMGPPEEAHSPEYVGRAVVAVAADPDAQSLSGASLQTATFGERYGFADVDGRTFEPFRMPDENRLD